MNSKNNTNDTCGCCKGIKALTPVSLENLPGLPALSYRVGTHGSFKTTMRAALSGETALGGLTIRDDDDPSIALIDAWACVLDVLTFYQERIANEGYLSTAAERSSVLELARAVGYELKPGVAAGTFLAFTLDNAPGTPGYATIDTGVKVMSIPGQNEKPQTYETIEKIEARAAWNELKPRLTVPEIPGMGSIEVYLKGAATGLKPGDGLLFVGKEREQDPGSERWDFRLVKTATADTAGEYTKVTWDEGLGWQRGYRTINPAQENLRVYAFRKQAALFGNNAPDWRTMPDSVKLSYLGLTAGSTVPSAIDEWPGFNIPAMGARKGLYAEYFDNSDLTNLKMTQIDPKVDFDWGSGSPDPKISADTFSVRWTGFVQPKFTGTYTFYTVSDDGVRLWINGKLIINNWTDHSQKEDTGTISLKAGHTYDIKLEYYENSGAAKIQLWWSTTDLPKEIIPQSRFCPPDISDIYLDASYPQVLPNSWLVLSIPDYQELYQVEKIAQDSKADFTLATKTTRATLSGENLNLFYNKLRQAVVFAQSEQLEIAEAPRTGLLSGNVIELDSLVSGLERGKLLIISGKRMRAIVTQAGLELVSSDEERRKPIRPGDVLQILEPHIESGSNSQWTLRDRDGFTGSLTALNDSIRQMPAEPEDTAVSEVAELDGVFEKATPEKLKVVEKAFDNNISGAKKAGLDKTSPGEAFENGCYRIVGWNGESYVALNGKASKLARLVLEQDATEKETINEGGVWDIGGGWRLAVKKIIGTGSARKVRLALLKDGINKEVKDVAEGGVYTYIEKSIAGETDVPLFVTYIEAISAVTVQFGYTWAAGTDVTEVKVGDKSGISDEATDTGTILVLRQQMQNSYDPATVTIYANVARATHGETVREVLGSGSGAQANQRFMLKKQPLTYVSAKTPGGTESTIEVRVNNVKWQEVPSLYELDARIQGYIIRIDDNGNTALTFGDGKNGARLPSGQENIAAAYRIGIGMQGMVKANQLSLLMTRPLGVKEVTNPLAPTGAADPETRDQAKQNAPQKVLTLDRIVSLQDFEDFTCAFAGIGKARAAWLRDGEVRFVHITVASADAGMVDKMSDLYKNLWLGIDGAKDPVQQFRIDSFNPLSFNLSANVLVDSRYIKEKVQAAVTDALKQAFSFEQRSFGQAVTESEVLAVMQGVEGVIAVDLNALYLKGDMPALNAYLGAGSASLDNGKQILAGLLTLNPGGIELTEMRL